MQAKVKKYTLDFERPSGTSRGILTQKETWFLILENEGSYGIGECGMFKGLSLDDVPEYEGKLQWVCNAIEKGKSDLWYELREFPSIQFGLEQAFLSLKSLDPFVLFPSEFTRNEAIITINGLIWMGDKGYMLEQIRQKLEAGFRCLKMKIGSIDFKSEISLLEAIRKEYSQDQIELRVDANGAFKPEEALVKLKELSNFGLHSIEQPIRQGNTMRMKYLCENSPLPIALDEELIGIVDVGKKKSLLETIRPQYIILKPTLVGGYKGSEEWIEIAERLKKLMDINYLGTVALTKALLPYFIKTKKGHFVTVTSLMGKFGSPYRSGYCGAKHALHGFFDVLRMEHDKDGIDVTLICPGFVQTNIAKNALTADGSQQQTDDVATQNGLPVSVFTQKMIQAIEQKKFEAYIGKGETKGIYLKRFFPKLLHKVVLRSQVK